jgi:Secretion system C-terminal sorting domain
MNQNSTFTKCLLAMFLVFSSFVGVEVHAQCANNNTFYSVDLTPFGVGSINSAYYSGMWGGEYCTVTVCAGATYSFTSCGSTYDTQITLYEPFGSVNLAYDDDSGCGFGSSYVEWTADFSGEIWVLLDEYNCLSNTVNTPMEVTQLTDCFTTECGNDNVFYMDLTPAGVGAGNAATGNFMYGGEYVTVDVCEGATYTFSTCAETYDTQITLYEPFGSFILGYDDDGCGSFAGPSFLTWTADYTGELWVLVDDYPCQSNTIFTTLTVTQTTACPTDECTNNNVYFTDLTPTGVGAGNAATTTAMYGGEYATVDVCAGATYTFSTCGETYDTQISLYEPFGSFLLGYDDDGCGSFAGPSFLTWTADYTGELWVLVDDYPCEANSILTTLTVTQTTACPTDECTNNNVYFTDLTPTGVGAGNAATTTAMYGGEYVTVDVCAGATYTFSTCAETYDTQISIYEPFGSFLLAYDDDGCGSFAGPSYLTWTADFSGTIWVLVDQYPCLSNTTLTTLTVTQISACPADCQAFSTEAYYVDCFGAQEDAVFYIGYTGPCSVEGMWFYSTANGWEYVDLSGQGLGSLDPIYISFFLQNTAYDFSFVLSDGSEIVGGTYFTGSCDACAVTDVIVTDEYCVGDAAIVTFVPFVNGGCSVYSLWSSIDGGLNFSEYVLVGGPFYSGDDIQLQLNYPGTQYIFYWQLSDGSLSTYYYFTPQECTTQTCFNLSIDYTNTGCQETGVGLSPSAIITPFFTGACTVSGLWISVNGDPFTYLDVSGSNFGSGDDIGLWVYQQDAIYEIYYVLDDGTVSPSVSFITDLCESGETICDCAGTQLPIEALSWQGDGFLDDGSFFWNQDPNLPVDFNCASWGFDCGDELEVGSFAYDPYGTCSGALPPANGCVDEFCYSIDIDVYTDCYPEEVSLLVYNANNDLVMEVPVGSYAGLSEQLVTLNLCLPAGCYTFYIFDDFGDGLNGQGCNVIGYFGIWDWSLNQYVGVVEGDQYTDVASIEYCVGPITQCQNLEMSLSTNDCYPSGDVLLPSMAMEFSFSGNCTVETIYISADGGAFEPLDVTGFGWGSGDIGAIYYMQPNTSYEVYYVTDDGATSYLYSWTTGDCNNEVTICDCDGTQLSIGVTDWLGDGFADNGFYQWAGQYVNFNCSTWGYDCGDIDGSPNVDPYNVCEGGLPPFNGCIEDAPVLGCTDPSAINYNPAAEINDGSCIYDIQIGCTNPAACNYNEFAVIDNGTCEFITCAGCTDDSATNYDPTATIDDGSCIYVELEGCTDPNALNYDAAATQDDGSCVYDCVWPQVAYDAHCTQGDLDGFYIDVDLNTLGNGAPYTVTNSFNNQQQVMSLLGELTMGPFPNGTQVVIQVTSNSIDCLITSQPLTQDCSAGGVYGCTDPTALNYNPNATIDDGSCVYIGVEEMEAGQFGLYPNPAKDIVTLTSTAKTGMVQIHILDAAGRIILETQAILGNGSNATLELGDLAQGNYVIELISEGQIEHLPLMIQK